MKGKIGLVVGLGVGYVLGTRAGRERYEQIKTQWLKVWNTDPVQERVDKVKGFVGDKAAAVPGAVWTGASRSQSWLDGTSAPSGTRHTQPERASLSTSPSPASTKTGRRWVGRVAPA